jgi:hypothetical protein
MAKQLDGNSAQKSNDELQHPTTDPENDPINNINESWKEHWPNNAQRWKDDPVLVPAANPVCSRSERRARTADGQMMNGWRKDEGAADQPRWRASQREVAPAEEEMNEREKMINDWIS